jgi:phospholipase C
MAGNQLGSVNHIVVLMLENRSFDHMLGFLYGDSGNISPATKQPFDGLTGTESNAGTGGNAVPVAALTGATPSVYYMPGADPGEGYVATNLQLFGVTSPSGATPPANGGFVSDFAGTLTGRDAHQPMVPGTVATDIMGMFTPELLPVLSGLARGFAVCDQWFSSAPTETFPNRAFVCAATSQGHMDDSTSTYTSQSIFGLLSAHGLAWSIYGYDNAPLTRLNFPDTTNAPETHFGLFKDFQAAAAAGTLGCYTFLEPSWGSSGNSQHPNYDVALGEQLIHDVYGALRQGPAWDQTLLIVTYDEHGGCYDHVPPPSGAVPPDNSAGEFGFGFTRFGVRVPAVLVSPLIAPGTVFRPAGTVPLDHTSILKTVETRWSLPPLTARDAAAPDLGDVLTLAQARTDDPLAGVTVPTSTGAGPSTGTPSRIQQVQAQLVSQLPVGDAQDLTHAGPPALSSESDYDDYIRTRSQAWVAARGATP